MIIHSTKLSTQALVKAQYGGTTWLQHSGYFLRGATSGVTANSAVKTGGNDNAIVVEHSHAIDSGWGSGGSGPELITYGHTQNTTPMAMSTKSAGSSGTNANIPKYKSVYIWERTA